MLLGEGECSSSCLHSGTTCGICHSLAETNSVTCLQHSYQHLTNILYIFVIYVGNAQKLIVAPLYSIP